MDIDRVTATRDVRIHYYIQLISVVILWYDHMIMLPLEVQTVWGRHLTPFSWLYLANRYLASIGNAAFLVVGFQTLSDQECQFASLWGQLLLFANQIMICALLLIRLYAIYARDKRIIFSFLCLGAVMIGVSCLSLVNQNSKTLAGFPGCTLEHTSESAIRLAIPWESMFLYDSLVLILTIIKTYTSTRERAATRQAMGAVHIPTLILRDGALYFAGMAFSNALNILAFYLTPPLLKGVLSTFNSVMGVTLVSRMVLNLRGIVTHSHDETSLSWTAAISGSQPQFRENYQLEIIDLSPKPSAERSLAYNWSGAVDEHSPVIDISHSRRSSHPLPGTSPPVTASRITFY